MNQVPLLTIDKYGNADYDFSQTEDIHISYLKHNIICNGRTGITSFEDPVKRRGSQIEVYTGSEMFSATWVDFVETGGSFESMESAAIKINQAMIRDRNLGILTKSVNIIKMLFYRNTQTVQCYFTIDGINNSLTISV